MPDKAEEKQVVKYSVADAEIEKMRSIYMDLVITDLEDKEQFDQVSTSRKKVKSIRCAITNEEKEKNSAAKDHIKRVKAEADRLRGLIEPIESHLVGEENKVKAEQERIAKEKEEDERKKIQARVDELLKVQCVMPHIELAVMTDEEFNELLMGKTLEWEEAQKLKAIKEAEQKAEAERLEQRRIEQEKKEAGLKLKQDELAAQQKAIQDEKDRIAKEEVDKKAAEEARVKTEQEAKEKAEREAKEAEEQRIAAENEAKRLEDAQYGGLERKQHLFKLADAFFDNLEIDNVEYGGIGLNSKRPFGNSYVEGDILEIIGVEPINGEYNSAQEEYAFGLYGSLIQFLQEKWTALREITSKQ